MAALLEVRDLHKNYGPLRAVDCIDLTVHTGEIFGILGPNGAGKTTTLECILSLRTPDSGSIFINGIDALTQPDSVKQIIGAQLQATALQDKLTPREALKFFGCFYRESIKSDELLKRFSLTDKADSSFDNLSAGQQQKLALALAFVNDPQLIFLDEPTAGLDPQSRRDLHADILQLKADGRTVVLSTHFIDEAEQLCDRIAIIQSGKIVALGTPLGLIEKVDLPQQLTVRTTPALPLESLQTLPGVMEIAPAGEGWQISSRQITQLAIALIELIHTQQVQLIDLQIRRASLEDAFIKLTQTQSPEK